MWLIVRKCLVCNSNICHCMRYPAYQSNKLLCGDFVLKLPMDSTIFSWIIGKYISFRMLWEAQSLVKIWWYGNSWGATWTDRTPQIQAKTGNFQLHCDWNIMMESKNLCLGWVHTLSHWVFSDRTSFLTWDRSQTCLLQKVERPGSATMLSFNLFLLLVIRQLAQWSQTSSTSQILFR